MDNLLEILIPILFFAIYIVSNILGKKSGEEPAPDSDADDDFGKIREELRRKIQERRQGGAQGQRGPGEQTARESTAPEPERERSGGAVLRESQPHRGMVEKRTHRPEREAAPVRMPPPLPAESSIERDLETQMEEVRRSKEKAEAARREASKKVASIARASERRRGAKSPASYRQFLREALDDPESLQKSFILHEVFGTPVGARREGQMRPSWDL